MPKVVITYDSEFQFFSVMPFRDGIGYDPEYQVVMDMKASHYKNIRRNHTRFNNDQSALMKFFIQAQMSGKEFREQ